MNYPDTLLQNTPFLRLIPPEETKLVLAKCVEKRYHFGDVIVREGGDGHGYYLIIDGRARVLRASADGGELPLRMLGPGDGFGEMALMGEGKRVATVRASGDVTVLRLDRDDFADLLARVPDLRAYIDRQVRQRSLENFLREFTSFGSASLPALHAILDCLRPRLVQAGEEIIAEGEATGPMFIIESGRFRTYRKVDGEHVNLAYLRRGDFFGELSFLQKSSRNAYVEAVSDGELLVIEPNDFADVVKQYSELNELVRQRIAHYRTDPARLPLDFAQAMAENGDGPADAELEAAADAILLGEDEQATDSGPRRPRRFRFPFIRQIDEADCGAAALGMICRYYGMDVSLAYVRELACTSTIGTGLKDLCRAADELGLKAQAIKISKSRLDAVALPAIVHWHPGHWLVLIDAKPQRVKVADPNDGVRWLARSEFEEKFSGHALIVEHPQSATWQGPQGAAWSWVMPLLKPVRGAIGVTVALTMMLCAFQLVFPVVTQVIVDQVITPKSMEQLNVLVFLLGSTLCITLLLTLIQRLSVSYIATRLDGAILNFIMDKMLSLPMSYFNRRSANDMQHRLDGAREIRHFLVHGTAAGVLAIIQIAAFLGLMFFYSPRLTMIYLVLIPIYMALMFASARVLRPAYRALQESEARYQTLQDDVIHGIQTVKSAGAERSFRDHMVRNFLTISKTQSQSNFNIYCYEGTVQAIGLLGTILFLWAGAPLVVEQKLSVGGFIAFHMLLALSYTHVLTVMNTWSDLQLSTVLMNRINDIIECPSEQERGARAVQTLAGKVSLDNVHFRYGGPDSPEILRGISFAVEAGSKVAIVGPSGAGKTTLAKCIAALEYPTTGSVAYDDVQAKSLNSSDLRRHIGLALHDSHLFSGSIADNIAFGVGQPERDRVVDAARAANAHDFIQRLPDGYDSAVRDVEPFLSSGQKQSIALARVIYREPSILVLDEAASDLDAESAQILHDHFLQFLDGRTMFIVTHRREAVRMVDRVLVLERGRIVEDGSHEELMARRGPYYYRFREASGADVGLGT